MLNIHKELLIAQVGKYSGESDSTVPSKPPPPSQKANPEHTHTRSLTHAQTARASGKTTAFYAYCVQERKRVWGKYSDECSEIILLLLDILLVPFHKNNLKRIQNM